MFIIPVGVISRDKRKTCKRIADSNFELQNSKVACAIDTSKDFLRKK